MKFVCRRRLCSTAHVVQSLLHMFQVFLGYLLMLAFMTYNVWVCVAVVVGSGVGYFLFGWKSATLVSSGDHCNWVSTDCGSGRVVWMMRSLASWMFAAGSCGGLKKAVDSWPNEVFDELSISKTKFLNLCLYKSITLSPKLVKRFSWTLHLFRINRE